MGIREDFKPYIDASGLLAPNPVDLETLVGSDNGPMFTSEYYIILKKNNQIFSYDYMAFDHNIGECINDQGMLNRYKTGIGILQTQEQCDDYYGVLNACMQLGNAHIPRVLLGAAFRYLGFLNNVTPGKKTLDSFLIRQPQLVAAMVAAAYPTTYNPYHIIVRTLAFPLFLVAALDIATSCVLVNPKDTDARRLSWHLMQTTKPVSILCKIASLLWYHRLYRDYGPTGMKIVASIYYNPPVANPYSRYWVD